MFRIDDPSAAASLPTPEAPGTPGYFTEGSPGVTAATLVRASFLNIVQEELMAIVLAAGITPIKTVRNQVLAAIRALISAMSIGISQTWQNVAASRAVGVTHTNSTGKPIQVSITASLATAGEAMQLTVGGAVLVGSSVGSPGSAGYISAIVPSGATYSLSAVNQGNAGIGALSSWVELR